MFRKIPQKANDITVIYEYFNREFDGPFATFEEREISKDGEICIFFEDGVRIEDTCCLRGKQDSSFWIKVECLSELYRKYNRKFYVSILGKRVLISSSDKNEISACIIKSIVERYLNGDIDIS